MFLRTSTPITHREGSENTAGTENTVPGTKTYRGTETPCREKKHPKYNSGNKTTRNRHPSFRRIRTIFLSTCPSFRPLIDLSILYESISPPHCTSTTCLPIQQMLNQAFHPPFHRAQPLT